MQKIVFYYWKKNTESAQLYYISIVPQNDKMIFCICYQVS